MAHRSLISAALTSFLVSVLGCAGGANGDGNASADQAAVGEGNTASSESELAFLENLTDARIFGILKTVNKGEIQQAEAVAERLSSPDAKKYADMMVMEHTKALEEDKDIFASRGIYPVPSVIASVLATEAMLNKTTLVKTPDEAIDEAYLDSQVVLHGRVLFLLDYKLLAEAKDPVVRDRLTKVRQVVAWHFLVAKNAREKL